MPSSHPATFSRSRVCRTTAHILAAMITGSLLGPLAFAADSKVIYMVIQAEPETTMSEVKEKFELARDATKGACNVREVLIEPIDPQTFTTLRGILQRGLGAVQEQREAGRPESIRPVIGVDAAWSIDLGGPFEFIEGVRITLANPSGRSEAAEQVMEVTGPGPNPAGYSLRLHSPGRYVLTLPKGVTPQSISFEVLVDDGEAEIQRRSVAQAWPSVGRAYLVTLSDVVGDESQLFAALKDPKKVSNPIREIQDATKASLMVASFVEVLGNRLRIQDGRITFSFPKPQGVETRRLWLLFPLTADDMAKEKAAFEAILAEEDGFKKIPDVLRGNAAKELFAPDRGAGWVELPDAGNGFFTGVFNLDHVAWQGQLTANAGTVGDNALLVYEFENEQGTKRPVKMVEGFVVTDQIAEWLPALKAAR
ncbi:MAG: hypothetical protein HQ464_07815 [Planctomycetes bacterium]|nr:hypothetical protein [Planctomycetota bacterium]